MPIETFVEKLIELSKAPARVPGQKAFDFLDRLEDEIPEVSEARVVPLILGIVEAGDTLIDAHKPAPGLFKLGISTQIDRVILRLIRRVPPAQRAEVLVQAFGRAKGLATSASLVSYYMAEHGEYKNESASPEERRDLTAEDLVHIKTAYKERVLESVAAGKVLGMTELVSILFRWGECDCLDAPRAWVADLVASGSDEQVEQLLSAFSRETFSQVMTDAIGRTTRKCSPKSFEPFVDVKLVADRVKPLAETNEEAALFMREWELLEQGIDPESRDEDL